MCRVVWAGDYADPEQNGETLFEIANADKEKRMAPPTRSTQDYPYIVNHSKKLYVDKRKVPKDSLGFQLHPLPILTCEGKCWLLCVECVLIRIIINRCISTLTMCMLNSDNVHVEL